MEMNVTSEGVDTRVTSGHVDMLAINSSEGSEAFCFPGFDMCICAFHVKSPFSFSLEVLPSAPISEAGVRSLRDIPDILCHRAVYHSKYGLSRSLVVLPPLSSSGNGVLPSNHSREHLKP